MTKKILKKLILLTLMIIIISMGKAYAGDIGSGIGSGTGSIGSGVANGLADFWEHYNETSGGGSGAGSSGAGTSVDSFSDWVDQSQSFLDRGQSEQPITTQDAINAFIPVGRILVGIATVVLVVVGLIMGVKYMIAGANDKAQLKQKLIYYVISIVLVYGAVGIFNIIINIMNAITA